MGMDWSRFWVPRNELRAARIGAGFVASVSVLALTFAHVTSRDGSTAALVMAYVVPVLLIGVAALLLAFPHRAPAGTCMALANACLVITAVLNIATHDTSVGAQLLFAFPVFYAASQLQAPAAVVTAVAAAAAQGVTVGVLQAPDRAMTDFSYFAVTLGCFTFLQVTAMARQDALVARLRRQADVDPLTGLVTRRAMVAATRAALRPVPPGGTAVVSVDLDHFKTINDTYGHLVGDGVLVHLAGMLRCSGRDADTVARLGGDELMLLLPGCSAEQAQARAERIVHRVRQEPYVTLDGTRVPLSVSVGVGHVAPGQHVDAEHLYALADAALYDAKRAGRGRVGGQGRAPGLDVVPSPRPPAVPTSVSRTGPSGPV